MRLAGIPTTGWRLWAAIGGFSYAFFVVALGLAKIFAAQGSRWDIPWIAVVWGAAKLGVFVALLTLLALDVKR